MFKKILIANRGEIACRVIRSAQRMGIATVAVYSDADAASPAVAMADESYHIGGSKAAESYLLADRIVEAAKNTGAEAIHPGYGFLSENTDFAARLRAENLIFIGPPEGAIAAMGDKIESKKLAEKAGVNIVPGHVEALADTDAAIKVAEAIGYPVMLKASAGGGGKGMRIARNRQDVVEGFSAATNEARSSFGDDRVFVEKFIEDPRHIEIQILADQHGNTVFLGERECSIQRRHQKVIEEAPSPFLDAATRAAMGAQAIALAEAVNYCSAGTVEFIVNSRREFYFLEMNTRLQVEHPVTEMITGIDLVEQMFRVAAGEKLGFTQKDIELDGWAMEARIYAEDPMRNFLPSIGRLTRCRPPIEGPNALGEVVRVDTGVAEGSEISMFYDPMIAKLVTHGRTREAAIAAMRHALDNYELEGVGHNIQFLNAIMGTARFAEGRLTTGFIAETYPDGFGNPLLTDASRETFAGLAALLHVRRREQEVAISGQLRGAPDIATEWVVHLQDERITVTVAPLDGDMEDGFAEGAVVSYAVDGDTQKSVTVNSQYLPGQRIIHADIAGRAVTAKVRNITSGFSIQYGGSDLKVRVLSPRAAELAALMPEKQPPDMAKFLLCPMPGLIVDIYVKEGDVVEPGQPLAVIEAMKMENILRAERQAVVENVAASAGKSLAVDDVIMTFK